MFINQIQIKKIFLKIEKMNSVANKTHPFVGGQIAISDTTNTAPPGAGVAYQPRIVELGGLRVQITGRSRYQGFHLREGNNYPAVLRYQTEVL